MLLGHEAHIKVIEEYELPKHLIASLANCHDSEVSRYIHKSEQQITNSKMVRIEKAIEDLKRAYDRLNEMGRRTGIYLTIRKNDLDSVQRFCRWCVENPEPNAVEHTGE